MCRSTEVGPGCRSSPVICFMLHSQLESFSAFGEALQRLSIWRLHSTLPRSSGMSTGRTSAPPRPRHAAGASDEAHRAHSPTLWCWGRSSRQPCSPPSCPGEHRAGLRHWPDAPHDRRSGRQLAVHSTPTPPEGRCQCHRPARHCGLLRPEQDRTAGVPVWADQVIDLNPPCDVRGFGPKIVRGC